MNISFDFILVALTIATGILWLTDIFFWRKRRANTTTKPSFMLHFAVDYFPVFLIVLLIRSFVVSPFYVPTGSLEPTIIPTEFLFVSQFSYGLRLPLWHTLLIKTGEPKRGDIAVFHWPVNPKVDFIKRVIGVPGDKISYINKVLYVNGVEAKQTFVGLKQEVDGPGVTWQMKEYTEDLGGVKHGIYMCANDNACPNQRNFNFYNLVVPPGEYFMMGDNRDNSDDSRVWGFVPANDIAGKALFIFFSIDNNHRIRWHRFGTWL